MSNRATGVKARARRGPGVVAALILLAGLLSGPSAAPATTAQISKTEDRLPIRVRMSVFVGSRQLGAAPELGSVYSFERLADWLTEWEPGSDNAELQELFALRDLGEVVRQSGLLPSGGGKLETSFETARSRYAVRLSLAPSSTAMGDFVATAEIERDGELLSAPRLGGRFGDRLMVSTRQPREGEIAPRESGSTAKNQGAPRLAGTFIFVVLEAERGGSPEGGRLVAARPRTEPPYRVDGDRVKAPRKIDGPPPTYTAEAKEARLQGVVILAATIDARGRVTAVDVLKEMPMGLTEAAVEAIRAWRFEPATRDGEAVEVLYNLTINFRLDPEQKEP